MPEATDTACEGRAGEGLCYTVESESRGVYTVCGRKTTECV